MPKPPGKKSKAAKSKAGRTSRKPERVAAYTPPRVELLTALQQLAPEAFSEGHLDADRLIDLVGKENTDAADAERYYFTWAGRREATMALQLPPAGALAPCRAESVDFDSTANIYIEADNLEALKLMKRAYANRVKMIYIDPPYNTDADVIYKDNYCDPLGEYLRKTGQMDEKGKATRAGVRKKEKLLNGRKHSRWLSMMYPRLFLARELLREDGVIFVSIDDNEVHHLRLLMNMVFGEDNYAGCITVAGNPAGRDYGGIARMHDYLMVYTKSENSQIRRLTSDEKTFPYKDKEGEFETRELRNRNIAFNVGNRPNLYYPFYVNLENQDENGFYDIGLSPFIKGVEVFPLESQGVKTVWRWGKKRASENLNRQIVAKEMKAGGFQIVEKYRERTKMARSIWADKEVNTQRGTLLLKEILSGKVYGFPKPLDMLKRIVAMGTEIDGNCIVMDFFSGSSTTAHAVMDLNAEDGGARRCVSVQLPEPCPEDSDAKKAGYNNIAEIGKERLRRAGKKFHQALIGNGIDTGFRVYKLGESNFWEWSGVEKPTLKSWVKEQKAALNFLPKITDPEAVITEVMLAEGWPLHSRIEKSKVGKNTIYHITDPDIEGKLMRVCLDGKIPADIYRTLNLTRDDLFIVRDEHLDDQTVTNLGMRCRLKTL